MSILQPVTAPKVPEGFHRRLRDRFFETFQNEQIKQNNVDESVFTNSACFFKGIEALHKNYQDTDHNSEQQSTFWYLFGVKETDCYAIIAPTKQKNQNGLYKHHTTLFVPRLDKAYKMWMIVKDLNQFKECYQIQHVKYVDEIQTFFSERNFQKLYIYSGVDSDSKLGVPLPKDTLYSKYVKIIDQESLWISISNLRTIKTEQELELLRYVCRLTTDAHLKVIQATKPGLTQVQCHALFHFQHTSKCGCMDLAFPSIVSSGRDCATLHYIQNDKIIQDGQMCLHDMGGKWYGYCADQAITFPANKKFTQKQKQIYNAVYQAQKAVQQVLKPGVQWGQMHLLAQKIILKHLIKIGIVKIEGPQQEALKELRQKRVGAIFFPHGLGHFYGLRVHDLGGYTAGPPRSDKPGLRSLRTLRKMEKNMCLTVQPGCYFIDFIIEDALNNPELSKYLCKQKIDEYKSVGGVRLQDDVVITENGIEMLSFLPRKIEDLQKVLAGQEWKY